MADETNAGGLTEALADAYYREHGMNDALSDAERELLADGAEHTTEALCWKADCVGSLPWAVERIVAERVRVAVEQANHHAIECERIGMDAIEARLLAEAERDDERAARLALVAGIEALAESWITNIPHQSGAFYPEATAYDNGRDTSNESCADDLRALLSPADTAALDAVKAVAWDEGMRTGSSRAMRKMSDEPNLSLASNADNPYRADTEAGR